MRLVKHLAGTAHLFAACWARWLYKFYLCFRCVPVLLLLLALLLLLLLIYLFIYLFARQHNFSKVIKWGQWVGLYLWPKDLKLTSFCHHPPLHFTPSLSPSQAPPLPPLFLFPFLACRGGQAVLDSTSTSTSTDTGGIIWAGAMGQSIWRIGFIYGTFIMKCQSKVVAPSASL